LPDLDDPLRYGFFKIHGYQRIARPRVIKNMPKKIPIPATFSHWTRSWWRASFEFVLATYRGTIRIPYYSGVIATKTPIQKTMVAIMSLCF
jgi:hypothetical protein